jgi:Ca2+-binding RTX toxin-like protein
MATINLSNASSADVTAHLLWNLWVDHDGNRANPDGEPIYFVQQLTGIPEILASFHQGFNSAMDDPSKLDPNTKVISVTDTGIKIQTTSFSNDFKDLDVTFNISGSNLTKNAANTVVNKVALDVNSKEYETGPKIPSNISANYSDKQTWAVNYRPTLITNDVANDATFNFTSLSATNGKFEEVYLDDNGQKIKKTGMYQETFSGNFLLNENGELNGNLKKLSITETGSSSNGSTDKKSVLLSSSTGLQYDEDQNFSGSLLISLNREYVDGNYTQLTNFKDSQENTMFASALSAFVDGGNDITHLTSILFSNNDKITSKGGNTSLNGYAGNDALIGGSGNDYFQFTTALNASTNVDKITGFKKAGVDKIQLDRDIFVGYNGSANFVIGKNAVDADDRIIYDNKTGQLFYDADGTGSITKVQFATLVGKPSLTVNDIDLI